MTSCCSVMSCFDAQSSGDNLRISEYIFNRIDRSNRNADAVQLLHQFASSEAPSGGAKAFRQLYTVSYTVGIGSKLFNIAFVKDLKNSQQILELAVVANCNDQASVGDR